MIVDVLSEKTVTLAEAAKRLKVAFTTVYRWTLRGIPGPNGERVRLRAARVGASWRTSEEAIAEFVEHLTPRLHDEPAQTPRTPTLRQRASDRAARLLEGMGFGDASGRRG